RTRYPRYGTFRPGLTDGQGDPPKAGQPRLELRLRAMEVAEPVDLEMLRRERLRRLQEAMRALEMEACLLFNEPNIRYATGASAMPVYAMSTFARCAVVPQEGTPILFEHPNSVHRSRLRAPDVRPMHAWEFFDDPAAEASVWADETVEALRELG